MGGGLSVVAVSLSFEDAFSLLYEGDGGSREDVDVVNAVAMGVESDFGLKKLSRLFWTGAEEPAFFGGAMMRRKSVCGE